MRLPIDGLIPEILAHLRGAHTLVVEAPPGAGKTTRVPPALLELDGREVLVLEPRRLAARLAARLGRASKIPVNERLLRRVKPTTSQTRLTREQRADNVRHAFAFCGKKKLDGEKIVLLDDVLTTGATTNACAAALRKAGAGEICVWTVARAVT